MRVALTRYNPSLSEIDTKILDYFKSHPSRPKDNYYIKAVNFASKDFRLPTRVKIRHVNDVIRHYPHPDRSPGLPYTKQGIKRKGDVDTNLIRWNIHKIKYGKINRFKVPCTIASKTVLTPPDKKKFRIIWVYPVDMTIAEGMFAQPLICAYNSLRNHPYAIWFRWHKGDMHQLNSYIEPGTQWLGTDYSAFDVHVPPWLIRDAFSILRQQLDFRQYEYYGAPTDPFTVDRLWNEVIRYFIETPAKLKSGKVVVKKGGVPSGSYFTNLVDSICNAVMTHYILLRLNVRYSKRFFMGDDGLVKIFGPVNMRIFSNIAQEVFGSQINPDKSEVGRYVHWLGYQLSPTKPIPDLERLYAQLYVPSTPDRYEHDILIRARALWITSFNYPPFRDHLLEHNLLTNISRIYNEDSVKKLEYLGLDISSNDSYIFA